VRKKPKTFRDVISKWGDAPCPKLAADLGEKPDTVYHWYHNDSIPVKKWKKFLAASKKRYLGINEKLLVDIASEKE